VKRPEETTDERKIVDVQLDLIAAGPALSANLAGADLVFIQGNVNTFPSRLCSPVPSTPPS